MRSADVIRTLGGGATYSELCDRLTEIVNAVRDTGKAGSLSLTLKIKPNGETSVMISDEIKGKVPELSRSDSIFFVTAAGTLVRDDPRQEKLPHIVREEPQAAAE